MDFFVGADWLRGTDVDQLSSREAGVIALRLVKRLQTKAAISEEVACSLVAAITEFFRGRFLHDRIKPEQVDQSGEELMKIATAYLDERVIGAFANVFSPVSRLPPTVIAMSLWS